MNNTKTVNTVRALVVFSVLVAVLIMFVLPAVFASLHSDVVYAAYGQDTSVTGGTGGNGAMGEGAGGQGGAAGGAGDGAGGSETGGGGDSDQDQEGSDEGKSGEPPTTPPSGGSGGGGGGGGGGSGGGGGEGEEPTAGNNLSFPVIAADGFAISLIDTFSWEQVYTGPYTGLSVEERLKLEGQSWYAQKTEGNLWQAEFVVNDADETLPVFGVDWGDIVESVKPVVNRPFRLEVTLYHQLQEPMQGFEMALLAFPSSPNETQGTNQSRYDSEFATIVSPEPKLVIQTVGEEDLADLEWNGTAWEVDGNELPETPLSFAPELNVGGKYIYGASKGGWKPTEPGMYRITFYLSDSDISLSEAVVGNYADWVGEVTETEEEGRAATPVVDREHNLTYADVEVITKREGTPPENPGEGEEEEELVVTTVAMLDVPTVSGELSCEPYLTSYLGIGLDNDPDQVVLLQEFLNETLGTNIPLTGYFGTMTFDAVKLFQETYAEEILQPWLDAGHDISLTEGTGYVYITTLAVINEMVCDAEGS